MRMRNGIRVLLAATGTVIFAAGALIATPCGAASIPAWLDDGISKWNEENPDVPIRFVNIKDSYVWYDVPKTPEVGSKRLRDGVRKIVLGNGYEPLDDEETVTTGKPPVTSGPSTPKKCWSRSYVLNVQAQGNTKAVGDDEAAGQRQRMLTSYVCDDATTWWAAFRVAD